MVAHARVCGGLGYALVWQRAVASQMAAARLDRTRVELASRTGEVVLEATVTSRRDPDHSDSFDGLLYAT